MAELNFGYHPVSEISSPAKFVMKSLVMRSGQDKVLCVHEKVTPPVTQALLTNKMQER